MSSPPAAHGSAKLIPVTDEPRIISHTSRPFPIMATPGNDAVTPLLPDSQPAALVNEPMAVQPQTWRRHKLAIVILMVVQFLDNLTFSIVIPSLLAFLTRFDSTNAEFLMGVTIAVNSAATFVFSPLCGIWTDKRSGKECLIVTSILIVAGNILYGFAQETWYILVGRVIVGLGAGNQVVSQVYFGWVTTAEERATIMGIVSLVQVLAIILGPAVASIFAGVDIHLFGNVSIDSATMPGFFSAICGIITVVLLFFFDESARPSQAFLEAHSGNKSTWEKVKAYLAPSTSGNKWAIRACIYLSFTFGVSFTVFETVGTGMTQDFYNWGIKENGLLYTIAGVEAIVVIVITVIMSRFLSDQTIVIVSSGMLAICSIAFIPFDYPWNFPKGGFLPFALFAVGAAFSTAGFTLGVVMLLTLFSKLTDDSSQGIWMGYFNAARALSRILAPLAGGYAYEVGGALAVFLPTCFLMFTGFWVNIFAHKSMLDVKKPPQGEKEPLLAGNGHDIN